MNQIFVFLFTSLLIESVVEAGKEITKEKHLDSVKIATIFLGILLSLSLNLDFFHLVDVKNEVPYLGEVLTGIVLSRGSNYVYKLFKKLNQLKKEVE